MDTSNDLAVLKNDVSRVREDINKLMKIIVDSNGNSLISRLAVMETKIHVIDSSLAISNSQTWAIKLALTSSTLSFLGTLAILIIQFMLKK